MKLGAMKGDRSFLEKVGGYMKRAVSCIPKSLWALNKTVGRASFIHSSTHTLNNLLGVSPAKYHEEKQEKVMVLALMKL